MNQSKKMQLSIPDDHSFRERMQLEKKTHELQSQQIRDAVELDITELFSAPTFEANRKEEILPMPTFHKRAMVYDSRNPLPASIQDVFEIAVWQGYIESQTVWENEEPIYLIESFSQVARIVAKFRVTIPAGTYSLVSLAQAFQTSLRQCGGQSDYEVSVDPSGRKLVWSSTQTGGDGLFRLEIPDSWQERLGFPSTTYTSTYRSSVDCKIESSLYLVNIHGNVASQTTMVDATGRTTHDQIQVAVNNGYIVPDMGNASRRLFYDPLSRMRLNQFSVTTLTGQPIRHFILGIEVVTK
jgi:hypothetical protein